MSIVIREQEDVAIAVPGARLDTNTSPDAEKVITDEIERGATKIVVDFSETDYVSSAGLRVILKAAKMLKKNGGQIAMCNANEQIHEVLEISGFVSMLKYCETLGEAVAAVSD